VEKRVGGLFVVVETEGVEGLSSDSLVIDALGAERGGAGGSVTGGGCDRGVAGNWGSGMACGLGDAACGS